MILPSTLNKVSALPSSPVGASYPGVADGATEAQPADHEVQGRLIADGSSLEATARDMFVPWTYDWVSQGSSAKVAYAEISTEGRMARQYRPDTVAYHWRMGNSGLGVVSPNNGVPSYDVDLR